MFWILGKEAWGSGKAGYVQPESALTAGLLAAGREADSIDRASSRHVQRLPIVSPRDIRGNFWELDPAERLPLVGNDPDATWAGTEQVAACIELEPVGDTGRAVLRHGVERGASTQGAVRLDLEAHPDPLHRIAVGDDEILFVRCEPEPVRPLHLLGEQLDLPVFHAEHATERKLFRGIVVLTRESVWRIGEVDRAVRLHDDIVGAIEALAFELVGEHGQFAGDLEPRDSTVAVLGNDHAALAVERQPI